MHTTKLIAHKGESRIAVTFEKKQELISRFKKLNGAIRSDTYAIATPHTCWKTEQACVLTCNYWNTTGVKPHRNFTHTLVPKVYKSSKVPLMIYIEKITQRQSSLDRLGNYITYINELAATL